jgi:hypothetical protein
MANIVCGKLVPYVEEIIEGNQGGFRKGRSNVDQILTMRKQWKNTGGKKCSCTSRIY